MPVPAYYLGVYIEELPSESGLSQAVTGATGSSRLSYSCRLFLRRRSRVPFGCEVSSHTWGIHATSRIKRPQRCHQVRGNNSYGIGYWRRKN
jgi:hypothetical protein